MYEKLIQESVNEFRNEGKEEAPPAQTAKKGPLQPEPVKKTAISKPKKASNFFLYLLLFLIIVLTAATFYLYFQNAGLQKELTINNFDECSALAGSSIQESEPPVCVTKNGLRFTKGSTNATSKPSVTPIVSGTVPTDWKKYEDIVVGYSLLYPPGWEEPMESTLSGRRRVRFNNAVTIESGAYFDANLNRDLTYADYIEKNRPPAKTVTNYTLGGTPGKQFTFQKSAKENEYLIAIPLYGAKTHILTISYTINSDNSDIQKTYYQLINSFKFSEMGKVYLDGIRKANINEIKELLEKYKTVRKNYPITLSLLVPSYTSSIPTDPVTAQSYLYEAGEKGVNYTLSATLEDGSVYEVKSENTNEQSP